MSVDYSIIIPAYDEEELLPATLAALRRAMSSLAAHRGEIVVADNDSSDRTPEIARDAGAQVVFEEHRQIARARNVGGRASRGRYLIFVDSDTLVSPALLRRTIEALDSGTICGGGTRIGVEHPPSRWLKALLRVWSVFSRTFGWACGAYVFCLREAFDATGGFDERFYATEEIHFSRAVRRWGRRHGQRFVILDEPIFTSLRKLEWWTPRDMLRMMLRLLVRPDSARQRASCELWYTRPLRKTPTPPDRVGA